MLLEETKKVAGICVVAKKMQGELKGDFSMLPTPVPQILTPFISLAPYFIQVTVNCYKLIKRRLGRLIYNYTASISETKPTT